MPSWALAVSAIIAGLALLYLLVLRKREAAGAVVEAAGAEPDAALSTEAELARATMKIAMLESRLEEAEIARAAEMAALEEQYQQDLQKRVVQTEAAYQRQMVVMVERLAENGKGDWRVAAERERAERAAAREREEYPVHLAAKIAAWRRGSEAPDAGADGQIDEGDAYPDAQDVEDQVVVDQVEDQVVVDQEDVDQVVVDQIVVDEGITAEGDAEEAALRVQAMLRLQRGGSQADAARELDQGDLRQEIGSLEDFMAERTAVEGEFTPEAQDVNAFFAAEETPPADNRAEAYHEAPAAYGAGDPYAAYAPHEATAAKAAPDGSEAPAAPAVADSADDAVAAVDVAGSEQGSEPAVDEEVDPRDAYEGRWSELKMLAMQRVYARRLGSEMDADYIDEDEFLREMGIDRDSVDFDAFSAEQLEAMMGADNWDPLEELAEYLNGIVERQAAPANGGGPQENVHDPAETAGADVWENMVFASAAEARAYDNGHEPELEAQEPREAPLAEPEAGSGNGRGGSSALADTQSAEEQAAIAATVEAILSRAPEEENEPAVFGPPLEAAGHRRGRSALLGEALLLEAAQPPQRAPRLPEAGAARRTLGVQHGGHGRPHGRARRNGRLPAGRVAAQADHLEGRIFRQPQVGGRTAAGAPGRGD